MSIVIKEQVDENKEGVCESDDFTESENVQKAKLGGTSVREVLQDLDHMYLKRGKFFKSREDCDFFHMLPLNDKDRDQILTRAMDFEQEKK